MDRRQFIQVSAAASLALLFPGALGRHLLGADPPATAKPLPSLQWNRTLVLVELRGGNDGLNTVVPYADKAYYAMRPTVAIAADQVLKLGKTTLGLNPVLKRLMSSWTDGDLAIALGLGYPAPNRSHFRGIDIWNGATHADEMRGDGWVARIFDRTRAGAPSDQLADTIIMGYDATVAYGGFGPFFGHQLRSLVMDSPQDFIRRARGVGRPAATAGPTALQHILAVQNDISLTAERMNEIVRKAPALKADFPRNGLGRHLESVARLIAGGARVPAFKVTLDGFDTHAGQRRRHDELLTALGDGLGAFRTAMMNTGKWDDVLVATYSEFGRRCSENGSGGTDHGTAAPQFLLGGRVKGGLYGAQPSLTQLDHDDLIHTTDYRSMYLTMAQEWWGYPDSFFSARGLRPLGCIKKA